MYLFSFENAKKKNDYRFQQFQISPSTRSIFESSTVFPVYSYRFLLKTQMIFFRFGLTSTRIPAMKTQLFKNATRRHPETQLFLKTMTSSSFEKLRFQVPTLIHRNGVSKTFLPGERLESYIFIEYLWMGGQNEKGKTFCVV